MNTVLLTGNQHQAPGLINPTFLKWRCCFVPPAMSLSCTRNPSDKSRSCSYFLMLLPHDRAPLSFLTAIATPNITSPSPSLLPDVSQMSASDER